MMSAAGLLLLVMAIVLKTASAPAAAAGHGHGCLVLFRVGHTCLVLTPKWGRNASEGHVGQEGQEGHMGHTGQEVREGQVSYHTEYFWELRRWYYRSSVAPPAKKLWQRIRTSQHVGCLFAVHAVALHPVQSHCVLCSRIASWQFCMGGQGEQGFCEPCPHHLCTHLLSCPCAHMPRHGSRCTTGCSRMQSLGS